MPPQIHNPDDPTIPQDWQLPPNTQDPSPPQPQPPPIPPMPYPPYSRDTSLKKLKKQDKKIKEKIKNLEKELEQLEVQEAHLESCKDFFETDPQSFMNIVSPPSPPAQQREPSPPPIPPRPSFLESLASSVFAPIPQVDSWSRSHHSSGPEGVAFHTTPVQGTSFGHHINNALPIAFDLFSSQSPRQYPTFSPHHSRSPSPLHSSPTPPRRPQTPTRPPTPPIRHEPAQHCMCLDCMKEHGY